MDKHELKPERDECIENALRQFSSHLLQEKCGFCSKLNNIHGESSSWEGASYPLHHCCRWSKAWAVGALQRVLSSWAGDTVQERPEEVLVSHRSVRALQVLQESTRKRVQHKEAWWVRKHKQMRLGTCLNGHLKLSALKSLEADCTAVEFLPNG